MTTRKSRRNVISFLPVSASPCDQIPGGTVLGKVACPSFEEPIGWIVTTPGEVPPGESTLTKHAVVWHFLPTCGIEPVLSGFTGQGALQNAIRQQYRGFYDRLPNSSRRRVASGDDCEIDGMILDWCGVTDLWDEHELSDDYSVTNDVLDGCGSAEYWTRNWYGGGPGLSGVWYEVYTPNPALFIRQVRMKVQALLAEKLAKPLPPPKRRRYSKNQKTTPEPPPPWPPSSLKPTSRRSEDKESMN